MISKCRNGAIKSLKSLGQSSNDNNIIINYKKHDSDTPTNYSIESQLLLGDHFQDDCNPRPPLVPCKQIPSE
jgi:hypothetical protein